MKNNDYLTVAEFAEKAGISKQRVYQLLNKRLKRFVQVVDGKKMLDIAALDEFTIKEGCSNFQEDCSTLEQENNTALDLLKTTIDMLQKQLDEKDKTIHELTEALKAEQLQTSQAQALHGGSMQQMLLEQQTTEDIKKEAAETAPKGFFKRLFNRGQKIDEK